MEQTPNEASRGTAVELLQRVKHDLENSESEKAELIANAVKDVLEMKSGNERLARQVAQYENEHPEISRTRYEGSAIYRLSNNLDQLQKRLKELDLEIQQKKKALDDTKSEAVNILSREDLDAETKVALNEIIDKVQAEDRELEQQYTEQKVSLEQDITELQSKKKAQEKVDAASRSQKNDADHRPMKFAVETVLAASQLDPNHKQNLTGLESQIGMSLKLEEFINEKEKVIERGIVEIAQMESALQREADVYLTASRSLDTELESAQTLAKVQKLKRVIESKKGFFESKNNYEQKIKDAKLELETLHKDFREKNTSSYAQWIQTVQRCDSWSRDNKTALAYYDFEFNPLTAAYRSKKIDGISDDSTKYPEHTEVNLLYTDKLEALRQKSISLDLRMQALTNERNRRYRECCDITISIEKKIKNLFESR